MDVHPGGHTSLSLPLSNENGQARLARNHHNLSNVTMTQTCPDMEIYWISIYCIGMLHCDITEMYWISIYRNVLYWISIYGNALYWISSIREWSIMTSLRCTVSPISRSRRISPMYGDSVDSHPYMIAIYGVERIAVNWEEERDIYLYHDIVRERGGLTHFTELICIFKFIFK